MTNSEPSIDFTDMDEDLSIPASDSPSVEESVEKWRQTSESSQGAIYEEPCRACRGSGNFVSWSGRIVGRCFKCKGTGIRKFRTSPESRQRAAELRAKKKSDAIMAKARKFEAWCDENPKMAEFLKAGAEWSDFYRSLWSSVKEYGGLTDRQTACVEHAMAKAEEKAKAATVPAEKGLDLSSLPSGHYAVPGGDTRLKVLISRPGKNSRWHGFTFVSDGAEYGQRRNYGKQAPGKAYMGDIQDQLKAIMANPQEAMAAYGHLVGRCGVCNRMLEDEESVARGIGPICAERMGW